jgi:hypothetical protein
LEASARAVAEATTITALTRSSSAIRTTRGRIRRNSAPSVEGSSSVLDGADLLIAELQDRVRSLEDANRENRRIIAALTARIPAIEAPAEISEASEAVEEQQGKGGPHISATGETQPASERRSWWRRMFG